MFLCLNIALHCQKPYCAFLKRPQRPLPEEAHVWVKNVLVGSFMVAVCASKYRSEDLKTERGLKHSRIGGVKGFQLFYKCLIKAMSHSTGPAVNSESKNLELQIQISLAFHFKIKTRRQPTNKNWNKTNIHLVTICNVLVRSVLTSRGQSE